MDLDKSILESLIKEVLIEKLGGSTGISQEASGVRAVKVPTIKVSESDRLDTGVPSDKVYTKDLFTLEQSPRLGCGIMEMTATTFDWTLNYEN